MKKFFSVLLATVLLVSLLSALSFSATEDYYIPLIEDESYIIPDEVFFEIKDGYEFSEDILDGIIFDRYYRLSPELRIYSVVLSIQTVKNAIDAASKLRRRPEVAYADNNAYRSIVSAEQNADDKDTLQTFLNYIINKKYNMFQLDHSSSPKFAALEDEIARVEYVFALQDDSKVNYSAFFDQKKNCYLELLYNAAYDEMVEDYFIPAQSSISENSRYTTDSLRLFGSDTESAYHLFGDETISAQQRRTISDKDLKEIYEQMEQSFLLLEPVYTKYTAYNYYARQAAKLQGCDCEFITEFNKVSGFKGLWQKFEANVDALATSFANARKEFVIGTEFARAVNKLAVKYSVNSQVTALCSADEVTALTNYGTAAECAAYIQQIEQAAATTDAETQSKLAAKEACFGNSDRGTFIVNYKTAYNGYAKLVTLEQNKGQAYSEYMALLAEYNAASADNAELLTVSEYEDMRQNLEHAWWAMRSAANIGRIFQANIARMATNGNAAQQEYVAGLTNSFFSTATDAQCAAALAQFKALA